MLVTLLDSRVDAEILLFASPQTVKVAKMQSSQKGYLDGWRMAQVFAWLRPNELVWNYWVNNYLMGNDPPSFDILAWNADTTRLPAALHHQLLDIVTENQLAKPGAVNILDTPIDIGRIGTDTYVAVSYTHLDVYKRQLLLDAALAANIAPALPNCPTLEKIVVFGEGDRSVLGVDYVEYEDFIADESEDFAWPDLDERSAAAMCYTSGTTGRPKGVVYSHRSTFILSLIHI